MKKFKVESNCVKLQFDLSKESEFENLIKLLKIFDLNIETSSCTCLYDKDSMNLTINDDEISLEVNESKKRFFRIIHLKETEVHINSNDALKKLLQISRDFDAILIIKSTDKLKEKTIFVINDNGHDYINFDKNKYDSKIIKTSIGQILID